MTDPRPQGGTLGDVFEPLPPVLPETGGGAIAPELRTGFGENFRATRDEMRIAGNMNARQRRLREAYEPIIEALNQGNPGRYTNPAFLDETIGGGPTSSLYQHTTQERELRRIWTEIARRRAVDPQFLAGVPGDHAALYEAARSRDEARLGEIRNVQSRATAMGTVGLFAGGVAGAFEDDLNIATMAIPIGGAGASIARAMAREALANAAIEALAQPDVMTNYGELGEDYGLEEALFAIATAGVAGGAFRGTIELGTRGAGRLQDFTVEQVFNAMPEGVQRKWADRMTVGDVPIGEFLGRLSDREAIEFTTDLVGAARLAPEEVAAIQVLEREGDVAGASPFADTPAGQAEHGGRLAEAIKATIEERAASEPPAPVRDPDAAGAGPSPAAPERAAVSTSGRPQPTIARGSDAAIARYMAKNRAAESSGNDRAAAETSTAYGRYQFTARTWLSYYKRRFGARGLSDAQILAKRADGDVQDVLMRDLTADNARILERAGVAVDETSLYLAHFLGPADAVRVLRADPSRAIDGLVDADSIAANRKVLAGKSASEVIAWASRKMGGSAASVPLRPGHALGGDVDGDDVAIAQLRSEALRLAEKAIGEETLDGGVRLPPMATRAFRPGELLVDAETFQFKSGGDEFGVTERLAGIKEWNPILAGRLVVWEDEGGRFFVADGHQRAGLARRLEAGGAAPIELDATVLRAADGVTAQEARLWAALKNIAEGTGTAVDAAKVVRDAGEDVLSRLPPKSALVRDGAALARLSDDAFGMVWNERIPAELAAVVGHLLPDRAEAHAAMLDLLIKLGPANRGQAESIVRQGIAAGFHKAEQVELFGAREMTSSLFLERAKVLERGLARLRRMKLVYGTAAKEADTLERVGSKIARGKSEKEAERNAEALEIVSRLAFSRGPVADALNAASLRYAEGVALGDAVGEFVAAIRGIDLAAAARGGGAGDSGRLAPDGAGRGGDARAEGEDLPAQPADPGEPSLSELEQAGQVSIFDEAAAARFDDPDGEAAVAQAESLEHDVRMAADRTAPFAERFAALGVPDYLRERIRDNAPEGFDIRGFLDGWEETNRRRALEQADDALRAGGLEARLYLGPQPLDLVMFAQRDRGGLVATTHVSPRERGLVVNALIEAAQKNQAEIARVAAHIADDLGVEVRNRGAKSRERVLEKIEQEGYRNPGEIKDLARLSFVVDEPGQGDRILAELGTRYPVYDKGWKPLNGYLDRKLIVRFPNGGVGEVQIIPRAIADYKAGEGHKLYQKVRDPRTPAAEAEKALAEMKAAYEALLEGSDFAAIGKAAAKSSADSSDPSTSALRTSATDAGSQAPSANNMPLSGSATATGRSSSSNNLMASSSLSEHGLSLGSPQVAPDPGRLQLRRVGRAFVLAGDQLEAAKAALTVNRVSEGIKFSDDAIEFPYSSLSVHFDALRKARVPIDLVDLDGNVVRGAKRKDLEAVSSAQIQRMLAARTLDRGPEVDPNVEARQRQEVALGAEAPLRPGDVDQDGTMGLGLFDAVDQPTFRLSEDGEERGAADLLAELDRDKSEIDAIEACMKPAPLVGEAA